MPAAGAREHRSDSTPPGDPTSRRRTRNGRVDGDQRRGHQLDGDPDDDPAPVHGRDGLRGGGADVGAIRGSDRRRDLWLDTQQGAPADLPAQPDDFVAGDDRAMVLANYRHNYDRLVSVKRRCDPDNLFRLNPNIAP